MSEILRRSEDGLAALRREVEELRAQLDEANETLNAIRTGEVDAVVVGGPQRRLVYTLETADRPYRVLIEEMAEGAILLGRDGVVLYANKAMADLLQVGTSGLVGASMSPHVDAADRAAFTALLERGGKSELRLLGALGAPPRTVQMSLIEVDSDGASFLCGVVTDLTSTHAHAAEIAAARSQLAVEAARRESDERYRLILEGATEFAIVATDGAGVVTLWNTGAREVLGWTAEEVVGRPLPSFWTPDDLAAGAPERELETARREGRAEEECWRVRKSGARFWANSLLMPLRDDAGGVIGFMRILRDRTAQRDAEEALRRSEDALRALNETLELRVAERTAQLLETQEALRQSQKLEAMGQLTGGVAHDFNNLLMPIIGGLDALSRKGVSGERERRLVDGALQSAERAKILVQRLLAFARRQPLKSGAVDVGALVSGMADLIVTTSGVQMNVTVDVAGPLPPAEADAHQLELAILNLSINARDAMPGGGDLTISARCEEVGRGRRVQPGTYIRLSVADTGVGMDEATAARAIEPFFSTKGVGKGTGLGLSMVHGLVSQLGGGLEIESAPGRGSTVTLWLPVSRAAVERVAAGAPHAALRPGAGACLLVDDEELVRLSTADMLTELGYRVTEAASALEALELLERDAAFDLLVTDHLMPGLTGSDLARRVHARWPRIRVLLVSGYAEAAGVDPDLPRLTKPFREADLANALSEIV